MSRAVEDGDRPDSAEDSLPLTAEDHTLCRAAPAPPRDGVGGNGRFPYTKVTGSTALADAQQHYDDDVIGNFPV